MISMPPEFSRRCLNAAALVRDRALDLLFPRSCLACQEPVESNGPFRFICLPCSRLVTIVQAPACNTCGFPFFGHVEAERSCPHCSELAPLFSEGKTATLMKGPVRKLVHGLKYHRQFHLIDDIGRVFRACGDLVDFVRGAVLVPVPLHRRKLRERGFNQSLLIAKELARLSGFCEVADILERVKDTASQTEFDRARRQRNLKNAFAIKNGSRLNTRLRYILVDDVFTTGSTCNACAAALRRARIRQIDVVTFGHG
ncbi:MAG TPA: double zinc ribbon domain-containing protein [Opitutales bacterium]|nr:double zinc ribbon domain-containing protein [Opitutales bacterium]